MARQDKYEKRPLDGCAAQGFSAAYDMDRTRTEKELAGTMAGPSDACAASENLKGDRHQDVTETGADNRKSSKPPVAIGGRTAHDTAINDSKS